MWRSEYFFMQKSGKIGYATESVVLKSAKQLLACCTASALSMHLLTEKHVPQKANDHPFRSVENVHLLD
jgi:hypothetical protein